MRRDLPSGTVTFLFTDVEGSTKLLNELGDAYADLLEEHRRVLRDAFARHGGVEVDTQGDAFFVAFGRAHDALAAAADSQEALSSGRLGVRMGLHTGEPLLTEEGYVGIDVHRAARIAAAGHGGQILISQSTRDLVGEGHVRDLGQHRLKDLTAPERIYQLGGATFPPLKTLDRTNLPLAATPLVGRERELAELTELLRDGTRLVTVTGAGGSGKTRLALQVAAELADEFRDGVFFVPLAPIQDAALVAATIAQATGVGGLDDLRELELLVVVDNLEHLLPAASELSSLLADAANVTLLVTSRVRLRVAAELEYPLEPFSEDEAIEFFVDRARAVKRDVRRDPAVAEICRRLDGLPLALELAASRVKVLDPPLLLERLGRRLPLLTGGARDAPLRQQTLRATIEWSYALLETRLQAVLRCLAVFAGSFSLGAAEEVAKAELDEISALVDWSLLKPIGDGRFLMLETIREYALEALQESGETEEVRDRHLDYFLALVEEAEPNLTGPDQVEWYDSLAVEHDNVGEALSYACDSGDGERALMLAGTIWRFWWNRGYTVESAHWYARAFAVGDDASPTARARGAFGAAHIAEARGDAEQARIDFEEAARLLGEIGETRWLILALTHLAGAYRRLGYPERADGSHQEALALAQKSGDVRGTAIVKSNMAFLLLAAGDEERAAPLFAEALEGHRSVGDVYGMALTHVNLGMVALRRGDVEHAARDISEGLRLSSSIGDTHSLVVILANAVPVVLARGDAVTSAQLCAATEALCNAHGFELDQDDRELLDDAVAAARQALGEGFEEAWAAGEELELPAAVELAIQALD
ncbi:MAG TPA: adenylate/guanylate cyclase domain-containing protein [Gaiellaceae bacterium]|nr:adenylate/guanylate cyclase domain-containing protein [Gaiellaceae bacterium]